MVMSGIRVSVEGGETIIEYFAAKSNMAGQSPASPKRLNEGSSQYPLTLGALGPDQQFRRDDGAQDESWQIAAMEFLKRGAPACCMDGSRVCIRQVTGARLAGKVAGSNRA